MSIVFEPTSLRVRTERKPGSRKWIGILEDYRITKAMKDISFANDFLTHLEYNSVNIISGFSQKETA